MHIKPFMVRKEWWRRLLLSSSVTSPLYDDTLHMIERGALCSGRAVEKGSSLIGSCNRASSLFKTTSIDILTHLFATTRTINTRLITFIMSAEEESQHSRQSPLEYYDDDLLLYCFREDIVTKRHKDRKVGLIPFCDHRSAQQYILTKNETKNPRGVHRVNALNCL
jgi:hypothetical protein